MRAALRPRALLHEHELAALVVHARLRQHRQHLEREVDVAVEILVERVPVARAVAQDQRRRPLLARGAAALEQLGVLEREGVVVTAEQARPVVRDRREVPVERAAQLGDRVRQRVVEVAVAAVAEAIAGHVDGGAEAPAVEQVGQRVAFAAARGAASLTAKPRSPSCARRSSQASASTRPASGALVVVELMSSSLLAVLAQPSETLEHVAPGRVLARPHDLCDLAVREVGEVAERHGRALFAGK